MVDDLLAPKESPDSPDSTLNLSSPANIPLTCANSDKPKDPRQKNLSRIYPLDPTDTATEENIVDEPSKKKMRLNGVASSESETSILLPAAAMDVVNHNTEELKASDVEKDVSKLDGKASKRQGDEGTINWQLLHQENKDANPSAVSTTDRLLLCDMTKSSMEPEPSGDDNDQGVEDEDGDVFFDALEYL